MVQAPFESSKRVYMWVAVAFLVVAVPSVWLLATGARGLTEGLVRFTAPGRSLVTIEEPGNYTVFHEYRSSFNGKVFNGPTTLPSLSIVMNGPQGATPVVQSSTGNFNYTLGSRAGYSVGSVRIEQPGQYQVTTTYSSEPANEVVLALGRDKGRSTIQTVGGLFGLFGAFGLAAIVWLVIFLVRRSRSRSNPMHSLDSSGTSTPTL